MQAGQHHIQNFAGDIDRLTVHGKVMHAQRRGGIDFDHARPMLLPNGGAEGGTHHINADGIEITDTGNVFKQGDVFLTHVIRDVPRFTSR